MRGTQVALLLTFGAIVLMVSEAHASLLQTVRLERLLAEESEPPESDEDFRAKWNMLLARYVTREKAPCPKKR